LNKGRRIQTTFREIYRTNGFSGRESISGPGSSLEQTSVIRDALPSLLKSIRATILLDAPCGDYFWMKELSLDLELYVGVDIVEEIIYQNRLRYKTSGIEFLVRDITKDRLPRADCILCRDCLNHLSFRYVFRALENFRRSRAKYLLVTTFTERAENEDIVTGGWRPLNLQQPPICLPPPLQLIREECTEGGGQWHDKSLGLWRGDDIPVFSTPVRRVSQRIGEG
jgi:SAM-dependent methyltransferase